VDIFKTQNIQKASDVVTYLEGKRDGTNNHVKLSDDLTDALRALGDKKIYIPITTLPNKNYHIYPDSNNNDLDVTVFYSGVYVLGVLPQSPSANGISITNTGDYIAYDLASLSGAIGGLANKTIEIEFDSVPNGMPQ